MEKVIIAAMTKNRVIGKDGDLPWHYPKDLEHFKSETMGFPVIMGRKTYESLPESFRPLPGRANIVLTRSQSFENAETASNLQEAYCLAEKTGENKCFIIGGGNVYRQTLEDADKLVITEIHNEYSGDSFFPEFVDDWKEVKRQDHEELSFVEYTRK